jgi:hypothetical protein
MSTTEQQIETFTDWNSYPNLFQTSNENAVKWFGNPIDEPDWQNDTKIDYEIFEKTTEKYEYWKKLDLYNSGSANLKWNNSPKITFELNSHIIKAVTSQLGLHKPIRNRVCSWFTSLDLEELGVFAGLVAFSASGVVVHRADWYDRRYHPSQNQENRDPAFNEFANKEGFTEAEIKSVYAKLDQMYSRR